MFRQIQFYNFVMNKKLPPLVILTRPRSQLFILFDQKLSSGGVGGLYTLYMTITKNLSDNIVLTQ